MPTDLPQHRELPRAVRQLGAQGLLRELHRAREEGGVEPVVDQGLDAAQVAKAEEHEAGRAPPVHVLPGLALDAGLDDDAQAFKTHTVRCALRWE